MSYLITEIAYPFIYTIGKDEYREIVQQKFDYLTVDEYFRDLEYDDNALINTVTGDKIIFNERGTYQIVNGKRHDIDYIFPEPKTLEEFICDCFRCSVFLCWKGEYFERNRSMFMDRNGIEVYNKELLKKIEKE